MITVYTILLMYTWHVSLNLEIQARERLWEGAMHRSLRASTLLAPQKRTHCPRADDETLQWIAKEMHDFFHNQTEVVGIMPWVLTLVSALRFGGNAVHDGTRLHISDHDVDMAVWTKGLPERSERFDLIRRFVARLRAKGKTVIFIDWKNVNPTVIMLASEPVQTGWLQYTVAAEYALYRRLRNKFKWSAASTWVACTLFRSLIVLVSPIWTRLQIIDFRVSQLNVKIDPEKKVLWAGQTWPYVKNDEDDVVGSLTGNLVTGVGRMCDLRYPSGRWIEDEPLSTPAGNQTVAACIADLHANGFHSLAFCG